MLSFVKYGEYVDSISIKWYVFYENTKRRLRKWHYKCILINSDLFFYSDNSSILFCLRKIPYINTLIFISFDNITLSSLSYIYIHIRCYIFSIYLDKNDSSAVTLYPFLGILVSLETISQRAAAQSTTTNLAPSYEMCQGLTDPRPDHPLNFFFSPYDPLSLRVEERGRSVFRCIPSGFSLDQPRLARDL